MVLADARDGSGNGEGALLDRRAAQQSFESFGALLWSERAALAADLGHDRFASAHPSSGPSTGVETCSFSCDGDIRTIRFDGDTVFLHDLKGLRYLQRLLAEPNREFHVLDLVAVERGTLPTVPVVPAGDAVNGGFVTDGGSHAGLHLDDQAREAYRRRLIDIDDDIDDAVRSNDVGRICLAQSDREYLIQELSRAVGLGGRTRHVEQRPSERGRV